MFNKKVINNNHISLPYKAQLFPIGDKAIIILNVDRGLTSEQHKRLMKQVKYSFEKHGISILVLECGMTLEAVLTNKDVKD